MATYSLGEILADLGGPQLTRSTQAAFPEADGTRLAVHGSVRRGIRILTSQQLLDLPGYTLVLRMDSWRGAPQLSFCAARSVVAEPTPAKPHPRRGSCDFAQDDTKRFTSG